MHCASHAYGNVYQILENVCFEAVSPAGARGALFASIDQLRRDDAPPAHINLVERISIALHKLDWAVLARDESAAEAIRQELQILGAHWQQMPIVPGPSRFASDQASRLHSGHA